MKFGLYYISQFISVYHKVLIAIAILHSGYYRIEMYVLIASRSIVTDESTNISRAAFPRDVRIYVLCRM